MLINKIINTLFLLNIPFILKLNILKNNNLATYHNKIIKLNNDTLIFDNFLLKSKTQTYYRFK